MNGVAYEELISAQRRGVRAAVCRGGLSALALFYGLGARLRNAAFDLGWKRAHRAAVPVLSVGNLTAGGTGKTPLVAFFTQWFRSRGVNVAILSRGYRSLDGQANDEKRVLEHLCSGVPHLQQPDRVTAAKTAVAEHRAELLILDDGFQHRRLHRDLDVVLIDALNPFGYGRLLPRGLLREPLSALRRADLIILTRADQCPPEEKQRILQTVARCAPQSPVSEVVFHREGLINSAGDKADEASLCVMPAVAFCGIGNTESFRQILADYNVRQFVTFPDHHHYTAADLQQLQQLAEEQAAEIFLTTLKDLVKIQQPEIAGRPLWSVQIAPHITSGEEALEKELTRLFQQIHRRKTANSLQDHRRKGATGDERPV